jgi:hypothetical protein
MSINLVKFDGEVIQRWDTPRDENDNILFGWTPNYYGYKGIDSKNKTMYAKKDNSYKMEVFGGAQYLQYDSNNPIDEYANVPSWYCLDFKVYIDFDHNNKFESTELAGEYDNHDGSSKSGIFQIKIPKTAKTGQTTLRIVSDYYYTNDGGWGLFDACDSYYGEGRDYNIEIKGGVDIGISQITAPLAPLNEGVHTVKAMLYNYSDAPVTKCTIKESYATPVVHPQFQKKRPKTNSHFENLFFAGAYLNTGLPITIESAVISGKMAADALKKYRDEHPPMDE